MILRRVIAHFRKQEWTAIALDFLIVVVGVFVGLQVNNWNETRSEHKREIQIVADMLGDLDIDRAQYANGMAYDLRGVGAADASFVGAELQPVEFEWETKNTDVINYSFDVSGIPDYPADQRDSLWTNAVVRYFPMPSTSTYDAMVGAGDIKIIRDREIVRKIQVYYNRASSVITQNEKLLSTRETAMNVGAAYGLAPYAKMPAEDYFRLIANEPELAASLRILATYSIFHYGDLVTADERAAELQSHLKNYLETL